MLHLEIQKREEVMKTSEIQKYTGGTDTCMKILVMANKVCVQLTPNETYFSDSLFSGVKMSEEVMTAGVDYCGLVKTSHEVFSWYIGKVDERLSVRVIF